MRDLPRRSGQQNYALSEGQSRRRFVKRTTKDKWPFWPWGLLPLLGLASLFVFAIWPFAQWTIENRTEIAAQGALDRAGLDWANVEANGQWVTITGTPPNRIEANRAKELARKAKAETWLGSATPVTYVKSRYTELERIETIAPDTPTQFEQIANDWTFTRQADTLVLKGDVPNDRIRDQIIDRAQNRVSETDLTNFEDQLIVTNSLAPEGYGRTALTTVDVLSECVDGVASLEDSALDLRCTAPQSEVERLRTGLQANIGYGDARTVEILSIESVKDCNQTLRSLLETTQVTFASGLAEIDTRSSALLDQLADAALECPGRIMIEGHTDSSGLPSTNLTLSRDRAAAVSEALFSRGINGDRLFIRGFGADRPIANNETRAGRAKNRRIEMRILGPVE